MVILIIGQVAVESYLENRSYFYRKGIKRLVSVPEDIYTTISLECQLEEELQLNKRAKTDSGDILQPYQTEPHVEGDGGSILFWGCITANGPGYGTTVMNGSVDSTVYVDVLQTSLLDTLEYYDMDRNVIRFQQDNATPHTSGITQDWFSANGFIFETIRDWPSQSLDLNPIEHVWYQLKRRLNTYPTRPTTKEELEARITSEWYKFAKNDCLKYIDSMSARIKAVIRSGGGPTRF
ncbi:hypothetical protein INT46_004595 [Mucor plumbeus]|uniref:Tc1-like transposase DDE domain-containing protein n=1 Tax=Mucor plumbeus TaxID=97098 RepID=A0A8H7UKX9_9FUNG|nr:hypothetical protein INT46_004595 [Mucor plumbeus]